MFRLSLAFWFFAALRDSFSFWHLQRGLRAQYG